LRAKGDKMSNDDETEVGAPMLGDSIFDQFAPDPPVVGLGDDGLPVERDPPYGLDATLPPPLVPELMSCLAQQAGEAFGLHRVCGLPPCKYYHRQLVRNPDAPDRRMIERWCARPELRSLNGAALSLRDSEVPCCEFREPADEVASEYLDMIDRGKIALGRERYEEMKRGEVTGFRIFRTETDLSRGVGVVDEAERVPLG